MFEIQAPSQARGHWQRVTEMLRKQFPTAVPVMEAARDDAAIVRLVGSQLLEQQEEWQLERRCFFSKATMAKIPEPEEPLDFPAGNQADSATALASQGDQLLQPRYPRNR